MRIATPSATRNAVKLQGKYGHRPRPQPTAHKLPRGLLWRRFVVVAIGILGVLWRSTLLRARYQGLDKQLRVAHEWKALFERLGGVFIKFGQFTAVRTDQLPWEVCQVFATLLDQANPVPTGQVIAVIEAELQQPLDEVFSEFDPVPAAAASIGQVHFARLRDGDKSVAVKVQRPGIAARVEVDVALIVVFSQAIDALNLTLGVRQTPFAREMQQIMAEELSYLNEARAGDEFRRSLRGRKHLYAPKVYWDYTTDRVLVCERIRGLGLSQLIKAIEGDNHLALDMYEHQLGIHRGKLSKRLYQAILEQLFEHDISHADPHPGNIIVMENNRLCFIDFGAVAYYGPLFRMRIMRMMRAIGDFHMDDAVDAILDSWEPLPPRNIDEFKSRLKPLLARMVNHGRSRHGDPNYKSNGRVMSESAKIGTDLGLMAPWELLRYNRQIWQLDTTVTTLNPEFRYDKAIKRYFKSRAKRMIRNTVRKPQSGEGAGNLIELINDLPHDLTDLRYKLMSNIRRGEHAFRHSLSKASYVGKLVFDHLLALGFGATLALLGARVVFGRDPLNEWLRATLWPALPWWAWLLAAVYATSVIQRLRLRFTEIDVKRN